jgi:hypothetical protein
VKPSRDAGGDCIKVVLEVLFKAQRLSGNLEDLNLLDRFWGMGLGSGDLMSRLRLLSAEVCKAIHSTGMQ